MNETAGLRDAADLRREFDAGFAVASVLERPDLMRFVTLRIGSEQFALPLDDIIGIYCDHAVLALPSVVSAFIGVAVLRDAVAPVFDLAGLIGRPPGNGLRWLVHMRESVALAFDDFEGYRLVAGEDAVHENTREFVRVNGRLTPVLRASSLMNDIRQQVPAMQNTKEA